MMRRRRRPERGSCVRGTGPRRDGEQQATSLGLLLSAAHQLVAVHACARSTELECAIQPFHNGLPVNRGSLLGRLCIVSREWTVQGDVSRLCILPQWRGRHRQVRQASTDKQFL